MKRKFDCYICESESGHEIFSIDNYPAYIVPLPQMIASKVLKAFLPLYVCDDCGHMQVPEPDEYLQELIYNEYYNHYVVDSSEALIPYYRVPFTNFINSLVLEKKIIEGDLLEIGCSSGEKVMFFSSISKSYTGIDPSDKIKIAINRHHEQKFIQGYFPQALPDKTFDVIVTQFNLEHIKDVALFIKNIHQCSNPNGILLIQVPDCGHFLRTHQPNFLAHEHIQYFIKDTLSMLLVKNGFQPIAWGEEGPSLITAAIKASPASIDTVNKQKNIDGAIKQAKLFKNFPTFPKGQLVFYGVGPQLYWLLSNFNDAPETIGVIDDNPNYHLQGLPGYNIVIQSLSGDLIRNKTVVLSLNKIYHEKVIEKLKALNEFCSVMYLLENNWVTEKYKA